MSKPFTARPEQRIAKLLARAGIASRREIERMIAEGRVALNGATIETPATLLASLNGVTVDGRPVKAAAPARLFRFHKPAGLLTTERDPRGRPTIYDRLPADLPRLMPVGRLDLATEGLLLLTTDGELKRQLELPSTGITRTYRARAFGEVSQEQLEELIHGIEIEGIRYGAIDANLERRTGRNQWIEMKLTEGKNREVRRVLEHLGLQVSRLIRTAYGPFELFDLPPGAVDEIRQHELVEFRKSLRGGRSLPEPLSPASREDAHFPARAANSLSPRRREEGARARPQGDQRVRAVRPDRPSPVAGEGGARPRAGGDGRERGRAASAAHKTPARPSVRSAAAMPAERRLAEPSTRTRSTGNRDALHHRPQRPAAAPGTRKGDRPAPAAAAEASESPDKSSRPKRGAGWAKAKPRPSSRPTRRGAAKPQPGKGRPGGGRK